jgi:hypothetical protein
LTLSEAISPSSPKSTDIETLAESLINIFSAFPNLDKKIIHFLDIFAESLAETSNRSLQKLREIVSAFSVLWKRNKARSALVALRSSLNVPNARLRKHFCRKLAKRLQIQGSEPKCAQVQALDIEERIRFAHPAMDAGYLAECKLFLNSLS